MSGHRKWSDLRDEMMERAGAAEAVERARAGLEEELRLYELRHAEALSQVEVAGRLEITQSAVSKLEHAEEVRVSTLRDYLEALGARLELVAVFEDEGHHGDAVTGAQRAAEDPLGLEREAQLQHGPVDLAAKDTELVAQDDDLEVVRATRSHGQPGRARRGIGTGCGTRGFSIGRHRCRSTPTTEYSAPTSPRTVHVDSAKQSSPHHLPRGVDCERSDVGAHRVATQGWR